jgi:hypothetical protein
MYPIEAGCILSAAIAFPADNQYFVLGERRAEDQSTRQRRSPSYATQVSMAFGQKPKRVNVQPG